MKDLQNEPIIKEMEAGRRSQEITDNKTMMFEEKPFKIHGGHERQHKQKHNRLLIIYYMRYKHKYHHLIHLVTTNPNRYFLKILYCNNIYEPLRCPSNQGNHMLHHLQTMIQNHLMNQKDLLDDLETIMEYQQKRKISFYWQPQPTEFIRTQLSNRGWRTPHFQHLTQKGTIAKRLTREHYLKELFHFLGDIDY